MTLPSTPRLSGGWTDVTFHTPFPDDEVAIFTQVQTYNDKAFVKARNAPLDGALAGGASSAVKHFSSGFRVALERDQLSGTPTSEGYQTGVGTHGTEAIGWIAIQHGQDTIGGDLYQASPGRWSYFHIALLLLYGESLMRC